MSISDRLAEITVRANAATPPPWWTEFWLDDLSWREGHYSVLAKKDDPIQIVGPGWETPEEQTKSDAEFIAHARADVPWLVEQVRKRDTALQAVLDLCDSTPLAYQTPLRDEPFMILGAEVIRAEIEAALEGQYE